jgi:hypothetical protein
VPLHLSHPGTDTLPRNTPEQVRVRPDKLGVVTQGVSGTPHTTRRLHSTSGLFKLPAHSLVTSHSCVAVIRSKLARLLSRTARSLAAYFMPDEPLS